MTERRWNIRARKRAAHASNAATSVGDSARDLSANGNDSTNDTKSSRAAFCEYLVSAREASGKTLSDIAAVTRIPASSLERLENGTFEKLPADVFVRGFLRSYARCVGLDEHDAVKRYARCGMTPAPVASPMADELAGTLAALESRHAPSYRAVKISRSELDSMTARSPGATADAIPEATPDAIPKTTPGANVATATPPEATSPAVAPSSVTPRSEPESPVTEPPSDRYAITQPEASRLAARDVSDAVSVPMSPASLVLSHSTPVHQETQGSPSDSSESRSSSNNTRANRRKKRKRRNRRGQPEAPPSLQGQAQGLAETQITTGSAALVDSLPAGLLSNPDESDDQTHDEPDELISARAMDTDPISASTIADSRVEPAQAARETASHPNRETASDDHEVSGASSIATPAVAALEDLESSEPASGKIVETAAVSTVSKLRKMVSAPALVIDDADPEHAEREQAARVEREREDANWKNFLPPALLDSEEGSRRGALTLAVIILVIVATLTMSYLMRRPSNSGDGVTQLQDAPPSRVTATTTAGDWRSGELAPRDLTV